MTRRALARIAVAACLLPTGTIALGQRMTPAETARRAELEKILERYIAGDHQIVARTFVTLDPPARVALRSLMADRNRPKQLAHSAFALEFGAAAMRAPSPIEVDTFVRYSQQVVARRPSKIGTNAAEDRFELLAHQIGLALLEGAGAWPMHRLYLREVSPRLAALETAYPTLSTRLALTRALDAAMHCCSSLLWGGALPMVIISSGGSPRTTPTPPPTPEYALLLFENAARDETLRQEALVRAAFLQQRRARVAEGLQLLDRTHSRGDTIIDYASALVRAGLLDRQDGSEAAAKAYESAVRIAPGAQIPAIGLAAALLRAGQLENAVAAADRARRMSPAGVDPWPVFLRADARFVDAWMVELRGMLK